MVCFIIPLSVTSSLYCYIFTKLLALLFVTMKEHAQTFYMNIEIVSLEMTQLQNNTQRTCIKGKDAQLKIRTLVVYHTFTVRQNV